MVFRKPYAFLIKNFKRIHIFLLVLSIYIAYKLFDISKFVNQFMSNSNYSYLDPIDKHITSLLMIVIFVMVVGTVSLLVLLLYKKKPWKVYLIPLVEYLSLFFLLNIISSFFYHLGLSGDIQTTDLRMSKDLLLLFSIMQIPAIGIYVMRVFGLDIKKFNFNSDKEFLELSEKDREEFEVSFDIDKNSFIRMYRKLIRNIGYFYQEHSLICKIVGVVIVIFMGYQLFTYIFITNRVYRQGQNYNFNGFTIRVNEVYMTDKDYKGEVISSKNKFIVADITVTNHQEARTLKMDYFHIRNGSHDYTSTRKSYASSFQDLGNVYGDVKKLQKDESLNFIIVYKVDKNDRKNRFVLYYQENQGFSRKIKINVKDISKIIDHGTISLGEDMPFQIKNIDEIVAFEEYSISKTVNNTSRYCSPDDCVVSTNQFTAVDGTKILSIPFSSEIIEGKKMFDISNKYGKIIYVDKDGEEETVDFKYPFVISSLGKIIYTVVPSDFEEAKEIKIIYIFRNNKYIYQLK